MAGGKYQPLTLAPINFSLTEGTSIPAPPDSPPDTPRPPTPGKGPLSSHPTPKSAVFPHHEKDQSPSAHDSAGSAEPSFHKTSTNDNASTVSPTSPTGRRPSSVRKFLGFRPQSSHDSLKSEKVRPGSPATLSSQPSLTRKKSGSWFGKRKSTFVIGSVPEGKENVGTQLNGNGSKPAAPPAKNGPPPPALPELKTFGVSEDTLSLGADDMFKNIK
ncbi:hypothetical protein K458DRAFT_415488 [Lentithecium fluviatile CBS 122367]|uniref:Uncharacterized protein n=1 Tax=Lentithecium fluviatile CBS 122367 TaxID=1168545 RepID=A0A6G1J9M5_9PLEO|nr:hypothetical protein K458DRAFT_415488 [Lentithecium fluviatile CBS 122367]